MQKTLLISFLLIVACLLPCYALTLNSVLERADTDGPIFLSIHSTNGATAYVCGDKEIRRTLDGATSWSDSFAPLETTYTAVYALDADHAYTCHFTDIRKTSNGGTNWSVMTVPGGSPSAGIKDIDFSPSGQIGLAVGDDIAGTNMILRSGDAGANWTFVAAANIPGMQGGFWGVFFKDNNNAWVCGQWNDGVGSTLTKIYHSTNAGANWSQVYSGPAGVPRKLYSLAVKGNLGLAVGQNGEVVKSTDGGATWARQNPVIANLDLNSIYIVDEKIAIAAAGSGNTGAGAIYYTEDGGTTWNLYRSYPTRQMKSVFLSKGRIYVAGGGGAGVGSYILSAQYAPQISSAVVANTTSKVVSPNTTRDITVTGDNYDTGAAVSISGGVAVNSLTYNNPSSLTANITIPSSISLGDLSLTVTNTDGSTGTSSTALTVDQPLAITSAKQGASGLDKKLTQQYNGNLIVAGYFPTPTTFSFAPTTAVAINNTTRTSAAEYVLSIAVGSQAPAGTGTVILNARGQNADTQALALDVIANSNPPTLNQVKINGNIISTRNFTSAVPVSQNSTVYASFTAGTANFGISNFNAKVICETPNGISITNIPDAKVTVSSGRTLVFEDTVFIPLGSTKLKVYVEDSVQMNALAEIPVTISVPASNTPALIRNALVYPSPVRSFTPLPVLRYEATNSFDGRILFVDIAGRIVKEYKTTIQAGWNKLAVDAANIMGGELASGPYKVVFLNGSNRVGSTTMMVGRGLTYR